MCNYNTDKQGNDKKKIDEDKTMWFRAQSRGVRQAPGRELRVYPRGMKGAREGFLFFILFFFTI